MAALAAPDEGVNMLAHEMTPPRRNGSPVASPAKRRRLRASVLKKELWCRTRWQYLAEWEDKELGEGEIEFGVAGREKKVSEKENEKEKGNEREMSSAKEFKQQYSVEEVQAFIKQVVPDTVKVQVAEARKEWEASVAELRKELERVTEENQVLREREDENLEEKERLAELARKAALSESEGTQELRKEVARLEAALAWAEEKLERRLGSEMDDPIVGYDRCARCGDLLDEGYEPAGSDCSASDDEPAWLCSKCAIWDGEDNEMRVGCRVKAHGLECDSDLNGTPGVVVSLLPESSRYGHQFEGHAAPKAVKRGNLRILH